MNRYRHLLSPIEIRGRRFRNRAMSTAHAPGYAEAGLPGERYQAYHEEKAKGGIGLTMFGGSSNVSADSGSIYGQIYVGDDAVIPVFRDFARRVHAHDTGLMCQISHMGRRTSWNSGNWLPTLGPSVLRDPAHHSVPYAMSHHDIARVTGAFADAAWRCREGGLDGCELLATTHLLGQFLSPLSNTRDDAYGGSLENRARFLLEVCAAVRDRVGDEFIVSVRYAADESNEGGLPAEDGIALARMLGQAGTVDMLNVNGAYGGTTHGLAETFPGMSAASAPYVMLAGQVRRASSLPTIQAARLSDPATADWAIGSGHVDMAGLTRPHMADPYMLEKLKRGDEARIRPCVGAGYCIDRIYGGRDSLCVHNVSTGRETEMPHAPAHSQQPRRITVVGGGPAGMEYARVAALRGHDVTLHEASTRLGGQLRLAERAGWRRDMGGVADWLAQEIEQLGVAVHLSSYIDGPELIDAKPDHVVIATGGIPDIDLSEGDEGVVVSTWDILSGDVQVAENVLLYDETGGHGALSTADMIASSGARLEFVTPDRNVGRDIGGQNIPVYLRHLYEAGAQLTTDHRLLGVRRAGNALIATLWNDYARVRIDRKVDQVVVDRTTLPADDPFHALRAKSTNAGQTDFLKPDQNPQINSEGQFMLHRIGDALAPRDIHAAMMDANRLARAH